jgi:hypothetical protein
MTLILYRYTGMVFSLEVPYTYSQVLGDLLLHFGVAAGPLTDINC